MQRALPRRVQGEAEINGSKSAFEWLTTKDGFRVDLSMAGLALASGIDAQGPWSLGPDGVVHRLRPDEALSVRFDHWLSMRQYLGTLGASHAQVRCDASQGAPRAVVSTHLPEFGSPSLTFDLSSAQLLSVSRNTLEGKVTLVTYESFGPEEQGIRWPTSWSEQTENVIHLSLSRAESGVVCEGACTAPPADTFVIAWPASERITVPMMLYQSELSLRARVGTQDTWAILDSGASLSALDATRGLGAAFTPALQMVGSGSTGALTLGLGEIHEVGLGAAQLPRLPVVHVPIPMLDNFGARRPELVFGYSLFAAAAVRVDYQKSQLVLAKSAGSLRSARAVPLPIHYWEGKPMVEFEVDGQRGLVELDTGSSGGLTLFKRWATPRGLPGANARTLEQRYLGGAGTAETDSTSWRPARVSLGPIVLEQEIADLADPPSGPHVAGLVGNDALARCSAVVFDMRERTLWLEPPCDRPVPHALGGWQLQYQPDAAYSDRPWVVAKLTPGGTAERAGVRVGDRLLSVNGKPAGMDRERFGKALSQAPGKTVNLQIARAGKSQTLRATLTRILVD